MFLRSLYVHHFRNYEEAFFEFNPRLNLICGFNAQGKTNLLEAIHCLMMGRSFRSSQHAELIKSQCPSFYLEGKFLKHGIEQSLKITFDGTERKIIYNSTSLPSVSSLLGLLPGAILAPDDLSLIKGAPHLRRQFLDVQIAQVDPLYVHHLTRYTRAVRQRNQLLKAKKLATIESWEHEMSQAAAYIYLQRDSLVHDLQEHCQQIYHQLTAEEDLLTISYKTMLPNDWFCLDDIRKYQLEQLRKHRPRELMLGYTLTGPQKDDLSFKVGGKDVRHFASEGQQRSCVTALRLAEWKRLAKAGSEMPLMMVDDIGLSLDIRRRQYLLDWLAGMGQVFLTTTDETLLDSYSISKTILKIDRGSLVVMDGIDVG